MLPDRMELFGHSLHAALVPIIAGEIKTAEQGGLDTLEAWATSIGVLGNLLIVMLNACGTPHEQKELIGGIKADLDNYIANGGQTHGNA